MSVLLSPPANSIIAKKSQLCMLSFQTASEERKKKGGRANNPRIYKQFRWTSTNLMVLSNMY